MLKLSWWLVIVNGVAVFVVGAARLDLPSAEFWTIYRIHVLVALVVTALIPVAQASAAQIGERSRLREIERRRDIETCLTSSFVYCVKHGKANWLDIGIQAFVVTEGWWGKDRQVRAGKVRLRPVSSSGVAWEQGKGVIGRCWATNTQQYADLDAHFAPYAHLDQVGWDALPESERVGLSFDDLQTLKGKYGIVAAVPIMDTKDRYLGCVTADTGPKIDDGPGLMKDEILASLASTADLVAAVLKR